MVHFPLVVVGTVTGIIFWRQLNVMQDVATQQHDDTIESNRINREAYTAVQRAFVFARELGFSVRGTDDPNNPGRYPDFWWFAPIIENSGATPTKRLDIAVIATCFFPLNITFGFGPLQSLICQDFPAQGPSDPEETYVGKGGKILHTVLGPKDTFSTGGFGITPDYLKQTAAAGKPTFYYGVIHYVDIFDHAHITKFCFNIGYNQTAPNKGEPAIGLCLYWNCIDDECEDDKNRYNEETKDFIPQEILVIPPSNKPPILEEPAPILPPDVMPDVPSHKL
jgi:hypothetical protein